MESNAGLRMVVETLLAVYEVLLNKAVGCQRSSVERRPTMLEAQTGDMCIVALAYAKC
jgi:hypothetical protein